jgi:hypothetical protein
MLRLLKRICAFRRKTRRRIAMLVLLWAIMLWPQPGHALRMDMFGVGFHTLTISAEIEAALIKRFQLSPESLATVLQKSARAAIRSSGRTYTTKLETPSDFAHGGFTDRRYGPGRISRELRLRVAVRPSENAPTSLSIDIAARHDEEIRESKAPARSLTIDHACQDAPCLEARIATAFQGFVENLLIAEAAALEFLSKY